MNVVFMCVNFNGSHYTEKYIKSIKEQTIKSDVVVIDNNSDASDFNTLVPLINNSENVTLIRSEVNVGYFGGLNLGIKVRGSTNFLIVGNNDLEFAPDFVELLQTANYPKDVMIVAPNVITADGYNQNPHCRTRVGGFRRFLYRLYFSCYPVAKILTYASKMLSKMKGGRDNSIDQSPGNIHLGIGACYILLPAFFEKFSELDDKVFLYGEEAILAGQLMREDGKTFYDPKLIVHHAESAALSKVPSEVKYGFMKDSYPKYRDYL